MWTAVAAPPRPRRPLKSFRYRRDAASPPPGRSKGTPGRSKGTPGRSKGKPGRFKGLKSAVAIVSIAMGMATTVDAQKTNLARLDTDAKGDVDDRGDSSAGGQFALGEDVRRVLLPLFENIETAKVSRVTVKMLDDAIAGGRTLRSRESSFQIASARPDRCTIYHKEADRRTRLYADGRRLSIALSPTAYVQKKQTVDLQSLVTDLPVVMGPYPEPLLALSIAGVDPAITFLAGMSSVRLVDRDDFRGRPAAHLEGVQADGVVWNLWVSTDRDVRPLRLLVDLTPMMAASGRLNLPAGFSQQIRYDFVSYRLEGEVDPRLFEYKPKPGAEAYESILEYEQRTEEAANQHPSVGNPAPPFRAADLRGRVVDTRRLKEPIRVLYFWETGCEPCVEAIASVEKTLKSIEGGPIRLIAINTGQSRADVLEFYRAEKWRRPTLLDPRGKIADGYGVDRIPHLSVVGPDRKVAQVLTQYASPENMTRRLTEAIRDVNDSEKATGEEESRR